MQWSVFDNQTGERRILPGATSLELPQWRSPSEYLVAELSGAHGPAISVYVRMNAGGNS